MLGNENQNMVSCEYFLTAVKDTQTQVVILKTVLSPGINVNDSGSVLFSGHMYFLPNIIKTCIKLLSLYTHQNFGANNSSLIHFSYRGKESYWL